MIPFFRRHSLRIALIGMALLLFGISFLDAGSLAQRRIFLIGGLGMRASAVLNQQRIFMPLEYVIFLGTVLGFFPMLDNTLRYVVMAIAALIALSYIISHKLLTKEPRSIIAAWGLAVLAMGFATDAGLTLWFNLLLGGGSVLVAIYSACEYFFRQDKLAVIFFVLNLAFAIPPVVTLWSLYIS